jgi:sortase A
MGQLSSPAEALSAPLPFVPYSTTVQIQDQSIPAPTAAPGTETPTSLEIPSIGLRSGVVEVTIENGIWQVAEYAAGYHRGTARPGTLGNTVISGHKGMAGAVFARLEEVNIGDMVYLTAGSHEYQYQIIEKKNVWPNQVEVMAPTSTPVLTLITCTTYDMQRLIVVARLVQGYPGGTSLKP